MLDFAEMMRRNDDEDDAPTKILPEAAVMQLRTVAKLYTAPVMFKVGDLVTPASWSNTKGVGQPEIVIEVIHNTAPMFLGEQGTPEFGKHYNMRVLSLQRDHTVPFWVEAACYELYTGPGIDP